MDRKPRRIERRGKVKPLTPRFARFLIKVMGGRSLDEIQHPSKLRADFSCLRGLLAVEIKTLDQSADERIANVTRELERRDDWPEFYGAWPIESVLKNLAESETVKKKLFKRIGRSIVSHLKKANDQLEAHTNEFPRKNVVRLVVLINEDHEVYDPATTVKIVQHAMARTDTGAPNLSYIDAVLFLTERHATQHDNDVAFPMIVVTGRAMDETDWKGEVLDFLCRKLAGWERARIIPVDRSNAADYINSFATVEHIHERMPRHEMWRLHYRRNPFMRGWSQEKLRCFWDETIVISLFEFLKGAPLKFPKDVIIKNMQQFTCLMEEAAHRGLPVAVFKAEERRFIAAAMRLGLPQIGIEWVLDYFRREHN